MTLRKLSLCCFFALCQTLCAQQAPIGLDEVKVSDTQLRNYSDSRSVATLNDSVIARNQPSLTSLLNFNSVIYFKENGLGMVSSPSFRGTTASQTAVVWNGISINSQLNGQADFNTINTSDFNTVSVRAGGGSVLYGSSAIGGTVHLGTDLDFTEGISNRVTASYGSFNTSGFNYTGKYTAGPFSSHISISHNSSDNDYRYPDGKLRNENGQFYNTSYNIVLGYRINAIHYLKYYSQVFDSKRHFSLISPSDTRTMYKDFNTRNLIEWSTFLNRFTSKARLAFLTEKYRYYEDVSLNNYTFGQVGTLIAKYDLAYNFNERIRLNGVIDYTQYNGRGSDINAEKRDVSSAGLQFSHAVTGRLAYELGIRQEVTANYKSPVLFSAGGHYNVSGHYNLKANISRNFRMPTFNDLYWQGAGNPGLKPESSYQAEVGNEFMLKNFHLTATLYRMEVRDMIRWVPGNGGVFSPENTSEVKITGVELLAGWERKFGAHHFNANGTYAYTRSENTGLGKQLPYVPYHKATAAVGYAWHRLSATYQHLFTGKVYTQSDNNPQKVVDMYNISNLRADYELGDALSYTVGIGVLNLWNEHYLSVEGRHMPGRYFNLYLTFKF